MVVYWRKICVWTIHVRVHIAASTIYLKKEGRREGEGERVREGRG